MKCTNEVDKGTPIFSIVFNGNKLPFYSQSAMLNYMRRHFKTTTIEWVQNKGFNQSTNN